MEGRSALGRIAHAGERLPAALAFVYATVLVILGRATVEATFSDADIASAPVVGELYRGGQAILGHYNWFEAVWLEQATRWLPLHRYLWSYGAWALSLVALGLVAWSASTVTAKRWTGLTLFAVGFAGTSSLIRWQMAWSGHALAWVHVCLVGAFLVACAAHGGWFLRSTRRHVGAAALIAVSTGLGYGSDKLVLVGAIVPCAVLGLLFLRLAPSRLGWTVGGTALAIAGAAALLGPLFSHLASNAGIRGTPFSFTGADAAQRSANLSLLWKAGASLLGGDWTSNAHGSRHALAVACALVVLLALVVGLAYALVTVARFLWRPGTATPTLAAFLVFWSCSLVALAAAFVWSTAPADLTSARYLVAGAYAVVALFLVAASQFNWARAAAGPALGLVAFAGVVSLVYGDARSSPYAPNRAMADEITRIGRQFGVTKGYANYWDAAPLTWLTRNEFHIYPAENCQADNVCPYYSQTSLDWYKPEPGAKSMIIAEVTRPPGWPVMGGTSSKFGKPIHTETVLNRLLVYVYPYDVGARFVK